MNMIYANESRILEIYTKFDLSGYDFVIAQEPCDAIEHTAFYLIRCPFKNSYT